MSRPYRWPETWIAFYGFLLNFVWEMWQVPFFERIDEAPHFAGVVACSRATVGDVAILVIAYAAASAASGSRSWILEPPRRGWAVYVAAGLLITLAVEWVSTGPLGRWSYAPAMPTLPLLGTGLAPLLQWVLLPPLVLLLARGRLRTQ